MTKKRLEILKDPVPNASGHGTGGSFSLELKRFANTIYGTARGVYQIRGSSGGVWGAAYVVLERFLYVVSKTGLVYGQVFTAGQQFVDIAGTVNVDSNGTFALVAVNNNNSRSWGRSTPIRKTLTQEEVDQCDKNIVIMNYIKLKFPNQIGNFYLYDEAFHADMLIDDELFRVRFTENCEIEEVINKTWILTAESLIEHFFLTGKFTEALKKEIYLLLPKLNNFQEFHNMLVTFIKDNNVEFNADIL